MGTTRLRRDAFKHQTENFDNGNNIGDIYDQKWSDTAKALKALNRALGIAGNGWWSRVGRFTDFVQQIEETDLKYRQLIDLRDTIEEIAFRSYDTSLTEYHLGVLFGFNATPFIELSDMGDRLCEEFDQLIRPVARLLEKELCDADDDKANLCIPVNAAAVQATKATLAWLKDVHSFQSRLSKAADSGLSFF